MIDSFPESDISRSLGFKVDHTTLKEFLSTLKQDSLKNKIISQIHTTPKFETSEFEKNITKYYKSNNSKVKIETHKEKGTKTIIVDAVNLNEVSPIEKAFYLAKISEKTILSDLEANKLKALSPQFLSKKPTQGDLIQLPPIDLQMEIEPSAKDFNEESDLNNQKSYCICKKPYKEGELMIKCDYEFCEGWFHLECVGFKDKTQEEINKIKWYCSETCEIKASKLMSKNPKKKIKK